MLFMQFIHRLRRKAAYIIHNPYTELAQLHNEYAELYPNIASLVFDRVTLEILHQGLFEKNYLLALAKHVFRNANLKKTICLDVGANIGNHSLFFSDYFESVYSFEPHTETVELLKFNTKKTENIIVNNYGLSSSSREVELGSEQKTSIGSARVHNISDEEFRNIYIHHINKVDLRAFDDIVEFRTFYHKISFVKLDVEHHEIDVINGMEKFLKLNNPIIAFEILPEAFFTKNNEITANILLKLKDLGYIFYYEFKGNKSLDINLIQNFERKKYVMAIASKAKLDN